MLDDNELKMCLGRYVIIWFYNISNIYFDISLQNPVLVGLHNNNNDNNWGV